MSEIKIDKEKNRLFINVTGVLNDENIEHIKDSLLEHIDELQPGFHVVTDMTQIGFGYLSGLPALKSVMNILAEKQVGTVVRVGMKGSIVLKQIAKATQLGGTYKPVYVSTIEEAEAILDEEN